MPSSGDIKVTRDLIRAGQMLKIELKDHIILGARGYRPFGDGKGYVRLRALGHFY